MGTAFVFAGGGSLGAVEVGMLRALIQADVRPDFVVGSSVGAINAVQFAADPTAEGVARMERVWRSLRRREILPLSHVGAVLRLLTRHSHLVDQGALRRLLQQHLAVSRLNDTRLPCYVITTDLLHGTEVALDSGPAVESLLASTAIPGVFPPSRCGERYLVDGSVASNTPIATALERGASRILVLPTGTACALAAPPRGVLAVALHALTILIARQLTVDVGRLGDRAEIFVVPPLCPLVVSPYDFSRGRELIDRAAEATARWLEDGGLRTPGAVGPLGAHQHEMARP